MKKILTIILILLSFNLFSQNQIFIGTKSYEATNSFEFTPPKRTFSDDGIYIQIGKSQKGGLFSISVSSEFGRASIVGSVLIYLKNGKVINLENKINSDYANDRITVVYSLLKKDIELMKESNIMTVRFNYVNELRTKMGICARNGQDYFNGMYTSKQYEIQTTDEIGTLFK